MREISRDHDQFGIVMVPLDVSDGRVGPRLGVQPIEASTRRDEMSIRDVDELHTTFARAGFLLGLALAGADDSRVTSKVSPTLDTIHLLRSGFRSRE